MNRFSEAYRTLTKELTTFILFWVPEWKQEENGTENVCKEIIAKNLPIMGKYLHLLVQEAKWPLNKIQQRNPCQHAL